MSDWPFLFPAALTAFMCWIAILHYKLLHESKIDRLDAIGIPRIEIDRIRAFRSAFRPVSMATFGVATWEHMVKIAVMDDALYVMKDPGEFAYRIPYKDMELIETNGKTFSFFRKIFLLAVRPAREGAGAEERPFLEISFESELDLELVAKIRSWISAELRREP